MTDVDPRVEAIGDLLWLAQNGGLPGVAEIMRVRRRQMEIHDYWPEHDDAHDSGELVRDAEDRLRALRGELAEGTAGYPECEEAYAKAAALLAAEIDRQLRALSAPAPPRAGTPQWEIVTDPEERI